MIGFIFYILQAALILAILFGVYCLLLRRDASFTFNRFFLLSAVVAAFVLPVLEFSAGQSNPATEPFQAISKARIDYQQAVEAWYEEGVIGKSEIDAVENRTAISLLEILFGVHLLVSAALLFRFGFIVLHFLILLNKHEVNRLEGKRVVDLPYAISPFSFLDRIFIGRSLLEDQDALSKILAHENVHIKQRHSIDLFIVQLAACVLWFNPAAWWLSKSLKQTHEYIADEEVIKMGYPLEVYQSLLLRQLISNQSIGLVHNFNLSFIKKRITMMKIQKSRSRGMIRSVSALMLSLFFAVFFTQCNIQQAEEVFSRENSADLPTIVPSINSTTTFDKAVTIEMSKSVLRFDDTNLELAEFESHIASLSLTPETVMKLRIGREMNMGEVQKLFDILQKADLRKLLYMGYSESGEEVAVRSLLPPLRMVLSPDEIRTREGIAILEVQYSSKLIYLDRKVLEFVEEQHASQNSDYVVLANFNEETLYGDYLLGTSLIDKGFNDLYEKRSQQMFGKSWSEVSPEEYRQVRMGLPRAIFQNFVH